MNESITDPVNGNYSASYAYDKVGNRTASLIDGVQAAYTYDDNDRLLQQGGTTYIYDANGNTLSETQGGQLTHYTYDARNRMVGSETASGMATYAYYGSSPFSFLANDSWTPKEAFVQDEMVFFHNIDGLIFHTDDSAVHRDVAVATLATLAVTYRNSAKKVATKLGVDAVARAAITRGAAANRAANTARMQLTFGVGFGFGLL